MLPEHVHDGRHTQRVKPSEHETLLRRVSPELGEMVLRLRKRHGGQALRNVRGLHKMCIDYPTDVLVGVVSEALGFDLLDLGRIEQMVLRRIRGEYFRLADAREPAPPSPPALELHDDHVNDNDDTKDDDHG